MNNFYKINYSAMHEGVPIRWTGPLGWTTGLIFDLILGVVRKFIINS